MSATLSSATGVIGQSFLIGGFALSADTDRTFYDTTTTPRGTQLVPSFNFPFHEVTTKYPANSPAIQFGNSYIFTSKPIGPPQRMFQLTFPALFHYPNADGSMNRAINPLFNADVLDDFYQTVQTWGNFLYIHPRYGQLVCKFSKPLELPKSEGGEAGALKNVQIELVEVPT